jgi:CrcB protein
MPHDDATDDSPGEPDRHRRDPFPGFPVDPDVTADVDVAPPWFHRDVVLAISAGGAVGALARWGLAETIPHDARQLPVATLLTNVVGCFLIGVLMVLVIERLPDRRLVRPFVGTGVLGGFTTFSTYVVDTRTLLAHGQAAMAAAYLLGSLVLGLLAVVAALRLTERVVR